MLSEMSFALAVEKKDPEAFAKQWVEDNSAVVDSWFR